jgi:hypothetical protein
MKYLQQLNEKLVVISKPGEADFPRFGQIFILAGGGGSGKGFFVANFLGIEGKEFNVDTLKKQLLRIKSPELQKKFLADTGRDLSSINMMDPYDVSLLHGWVKEQKYDKKQQEAFFLAAADSKLKPNVIFDMTLQSLHKLNEVTTLAISAGYDPSNIHLIWVLNDINVALKQNAARTRQVDAEVLFNTHEGAALTMSQILQKSNWSKLNGNVIIFFAQTGIDNFITKHELSNGKTYTEVTGYNAIFLKRPNKPIAIEPALKQTILDKIRTYIPATISSEFDF